MDFYLAAADSAEMIYSRAIWLGGAAVVNAKERDLVEVAVIGRMRHHTHIMKMASDVLCHSPK